MHVDGDELGVLLNTKFGGEDTFPSLQSIRMDEPYLHMNCQPDCNSKYSRCIHTLERALIARQSRQGLKLEELKLYQSHVKQMKMSKLGRIVPLTIMDAGSQDDEVDGTDDDTNYDDASD